MVRPTSPFASGSVLPSSRVISRATASARASSRLAARYSTSPRFGAGMAAHAGCAARAAATAAATSSADDSGNVPTRSSTSAGLRFSNVRPVAEGTHWPAMRF